MNAASTMQWFLCAHALGLALWSSLAALNNLRDFRGASAAVGQTLSMTLLDQVPAVPTPLRRRAMPAEWLHRLAVLGVLVLQLAAAASLWTGCVVLLSGGSGVVALPWLNVGLTLLSLAVLAMVLGGTATAYWIRQEGLQLTHFVLLLWLLAEFAAFNLAWGGVGG